MRTQEDVVATAPSSVAHAAPGVRACRDCGRRIPVLEAQVGLDRLVRRFPGFSREHAYCTACVRALEVLLGAVDGAAAPDEGAR